jgi:hypothetical protein
MHARNPCKQVASPYSACMPRSACWVSRRGLRWWWVVIGQRNAAGCQVGATAFGAACLCRGCCGFFQDGPGWWVCRDLQAAVISWRARCWLCLQVFGWMMGVVYRRDAYRRAVLARVWCGDAPPPARWGECPAFVCTQHTVSTPHSCNPCINAWHAWRRLRQSVNNVTHSWNSLLEARDNPHQLSATAGGTAHKSPKHGRLLPAAQVAQAQHRVP